MGVVWKATDLSLGRDVAIKVLPQVFAADPERMARFEREARLLASLNHPHVASIHGVGLVGDIHFLVMELVEGDDLSQRIARGPLPMDEAVETARQVAEALEFAHEKGIIHRDLKPANVKFTAGGQVKVLDFGLAKALEGEPEPRASSGLTHSPTLTSPMTAANVILGTAAYMSPEQARGKLVDRRADIWAFGCLLLECLTGRPTFAGETVSDTIARILEREPDWSSLPSGTPPRLRELLRRCLEKDARKRQRDIGDARLVLEEVIAAGLSATGMTAAAMRSARTGGPGRAAAMLPWGVAIVALAGGLAALWLPSPWRAGPAAAVTRTTIAWPAGVKMSGFPADAALSPDGTLLAFSATDSLGMARIYVRPLASLEAQSIRGTEHMGSEGESPTLPFWSPDEKSIGFFADDRLKTIAITGGAAQALASVSNARGGTWSRQGLILFAPSSQGALFSVPASGGEATPVTTLDSTMHETAHRFPHFLPDGRHFTFVTLPATADGKLSTWVSELGSHARRRIVEAGSGALFVPPGYMLFVRDQSLMAQRADPADARLGGGPERIGDAPEDLSILGGDPATASGNGSLVVPGTASASRRLTWFDRDGRSHGDLPVQAADYRDVVVSPDGRQVALARWISPLSNEVWIADAASGAMTQLTNDGRLKVGLRWSADGREIAYSLPATGAWDYFMRPVSAAEGERPLFHSASAFKSFSQLTPDGTSIIFDDLAKSTQRDLWVAPILGSGPPHVYLRTPFNESAGQVSPDGHWMAYQSDESGRSEIYVRSYPTPGEKLRISTGGGTVPAWRDDGKEISYFWSPSIVCVPVQTSPSFVVGKPAPPIPMPRGILTLGFIPFGVSPHFDRFLFAIPTDETQAASLTLVTNWPSLLRR